MYCKNLCVLNFCTPPVCILSILLPFMAWKTVNNSQIFNFTQQQTCWKVKQYVLWSVSKEEKKSVIELIKNRVNNFVFSNFLTCTCTVIRNLHVWNWVLVYVNPCFHVGNFKIKDSNTLILVNVMRITQCMYSHIRVNINSYVDYIRSQIYSPVMKYFEHVTSSIRQRAGIFLRKL